MRYDVQQTKYFCHLGQFFALLPPNSPKNENIKNEKIPWRYHHFTQVYQKSSSSRDCSKDMTHNGCNCYLHFGLYFSFLLTVQKMKILQQWKKGQEISSFYTSAPIIMIICYTVPEIWHVTDIIVNFYFGLFFALLPP